MTTDHLGSPRIITEQNGSVISRKDFAAFGDEVVSSQRVGGTNGNGYDPPNVRQDYTGYQKDGESGLEFAQARYYNASHGRFTSADPLTASASIKNPQSFNRYSYVLNSPYKFTDPLGLVTMGPGFCGADSSNCDNQSYDLWAGKEAPKQTQDRKKPTSPPGTGKGGGKPTPSKPKPPPKPAPKGQPQTIDTSKDKVIGAAIDKINQKATPITGPRTPAEIRYVPGQTTVATNATVLDADGEVIATNITGYVKPVAVIMLDQGGNIINSPRMTVTETVTTANAEARQIEAAGGLVTTNGSPVQQAENGVFYDYQIRVAGSIVHNNIQTKQNLEIKMGASTLWNINGIRIVKSDSKKTITITPGTIVRSQ